jgi:hypothetical protein
MVVRFVVKSWIVLKLEGRDCLLQEKKRHKKEGKIREREKMIDRQVIN